MTKLNYTIKDGMRICTSWRLELSKKQTHSSFESSTNINDESSAENVNTKPGCSKDDNIIYSILLSRYMDIESGLDFLNVPLTSIGESPVIKIPIYMNFVIFIISILIIVEQ